jgi:hypothetical protein
MTRDRSVYTKTMAVAHRLEIVMPNPHFELFTL